MTGDAALYWGMGLMGVTVLLLVAEALIPSGGIIAAVAGVFGVSSVVIFWRHDPIWGGVSLSILLVLAPLTFYYSLQILPNTGLGRALTGAEAEENEKQRELAELERRREREALMGAEGVALTDLRPIGEVRIGEQRMEALAEGRWIEAGEPIRVSKATGLEVKVRPKA